MSNNIRFHTNTAWLLNMWFKDNKSELYKEVKEWVEKQHNNHWKGINSSVVEVTFKILTKQKVTKQKAVNLEELK